MPWGGRAGEHAPHSACAPRSASWVPTVQHSAVQVSTVYIYIYIGTQHQYVNVSV